MTWEHERLPVYRLALELAGDLDKVAREIRPERPDLCDQLRRSSAAVALNIAEGASEFRRAEKARIYRIARREAAECAAAMDIAEFLPQCRGKLSDHRGRLEHVSSQLTLLIKGLDRK